MPLLVSFMKAHGIGHVANLAVSKPRAFESVALESTSTNAAKDGEWAIVVSTETDTVLAAVGQKPDVSAEVATQSTSAAFALPPNVPMPIYLNAGDKLAFGAVS